MPQKKKKPMKPVKAAKKAPSPKGAKAPVGSVLKKAAKAVAKKMGTALIGKKKPEPKKLVKPVTVKATKQPAVDKKMVVGKVAPQAEKKKVVAASPAAPATKTKEGKGIASKAKVAEAPAASSAKVDKKKKSEVVLEVPAPKGVALLGREGKKKGRSSESSSVSSKRRCREPGCEHEFSLSGYCRLHYIKNWRKIKRKEAILASGQLNNYVEELVSKYPDKYLEVIRQDLASEKDWGKVVVDLELESSDEDGAGDEDMEGVSEGVRREREFDDDSDSF